MAQYRSAAAEGTHLKAKASLKNERCVVTQPPPTVEDLEREIRVLRGERDDLMKRIVAIPKNLQIAAVQLSEAEKALLSIRQARDAVIARSSELSEKLLKANDRLDELTDELELSDHAKQAALEQLNNVQREVAELRVKVTLLSHGPVQAMDQNSAEAELEVALMKMQRQLATVESREEQAKSRQKQSMAHLIEQFTEERKRMQREYDKLKASTDVEMSAMQAQLASRSKDSSAAAELDRHRVEIADLLAEIEATREELRLARMPETAEPAISTSPARTPVEVLSSADGRSEKSALTPELQKELTAIGKAIEEVDKDPSNLAALDVMASQFQDFSRQAISAGRPAAHRVATTCADVAGWLRKTPKKIHVMAKPLEDARQLLARLMSIPSDAVSDPGGAAVYAVDDDVDNCECMAMALQKSELETRYAMKVDVALSELSKNPYDLIILDVDLGGDVDGFELHRRLRAMELHQKTPVIFVSGLMSAQEKIAGISDELDAFVGKPYNLNELSLKALETILKARLARVNG